MRGRDRRCSSDAGRHWGKGSRLRFHWDVTPENADRIEKKLAEIRENTKQQGNENIE